MKLFKIVCLASISICLLDAKLIRNSSLNVVLDTVNMQMWQDTVENKNVRKTFSEAIPYCETLDFAGYTDWRLSNTVELRKLYTHNTFDNVFVHKADYYYISNHAFTYSSDNTVRTYSFRNSDSKYYVASQTAGSNYRCVRDYKIK